MPKRNLAQLNYSEYTFSVNVRASLLHPHSLSMEHVTLHRNAALKVGLSMATAPPVLAYVASSPFPLVDQPSPIIAPTFKIPVIHPLNQRAPLVATKSHPRATTSANYD